MLPSAIRIARACLFGALLGLAAAAPARAEPVRLDFEGRQLNGNLQLAGGAGIGQGVMLLVHGTLAHNRLEIMRDLQALLGERGISTLAVTLSLGLPDRSGMYDCALPHRHGNAQAVAEIAAWVGWAQRQGAAKIGLLGHSRGGAQVALYAARGGDALPAAVQRIVLAAPTTFDAARAPADYRARFGGDFDAVLKQAQAMAAAGRGGELMQQTDFMYCPKTSVAADTFLDYHSGDGRNDAPSQLAAIRRPVLVVLAGGDEVVRDLPQKLAAARKPAGLKVVTVDAADHFFQELFGEDLADAVAAFWQE